MGHSPCEFMHDLYRHQATFVAFDSMGLFIEFYTVTDSSGKSYI